MRFTIVIYFLLLTFLLSSTSCTKKSDLGSKNNPVKLYFTPSVDAESIATNSKELLKFLKQETGLHFKSGIPTSYVAVVEAFGSKRADIAVMNSFGYLMANSKYGAQAKLKVIRHGQDYYQGQIITRTDSGINKLEDLKGKKIAFTDPSSTSGYLFPLKALRDHNVLIGHSVFAIKHDNVITMVYQKQVDAGASFYSPPSSSGIARDARARVKTQFPDVLEKIKIIFITEKIPNDPFVFRKDLDPSITKKFITAIKKFFLTKNGVQIFKNIYAVDGVVDCSDDDYNSLREAIKTLNLEASSLIK